MFSDFSVFINQTAMKCMSVKQKVFTVAVDCKNLLQSRCQNSEVILAIYDR